MPTAISVANLQTALGNLHDAIASQDWANAWLYYGQYFAQYHGIPSGSLDGASYTFPRPDTLKDMIDEVKAAQSKASGRRIIGTRTSHAR